MKRILSLDGGGIRGMFTLQVLKRIESLFRHRESNPDLVLADRFDMFAGTSTGAIIATCLCWGMEVEAIEKLYVERGGEMFTRSKLFRRLWAKYRSDRLADLFAEIFSEDGKGARPADLGTDRLRGTLLVVVRNATTGSAWPLTNNPRAVFNDASLPLCNLRVPLWQLLRASTAAPTYFAPESITLGGKEFLFVDGGVTAYNNPAALAVMQATLKPYRMQWPTGRRRLHVVSVGTGGMRATLSKDVASRINLFDMLPYVPKATIGSSMNQQDLICRVLGDCLHGDVIDIEIGDLQTPTLLAADQQLFTYVRYDKRLDTRDDETHLPPLTKAALDDLTLIPELQALGEEYAERHVQDWHLDPRAGET